MIYFVLSGILLALLLKKNPLTLPLNLKFKVPYVIIGCLLVQVAIELVSFLNQTKIETILVITFIVLFIGLLLNRQIVGIKWVMVGLFLNMMAVMLNGGFMPVSKTAMEIANLQHLMDFSRDSRHQLMEDSHIGWLGDWIPFLTPVGTNYVLSPGDLLVGVGLIILIIRNSSGRSKTV
jgi:heme/copper-type cytochrome/quinol oxidase subunit 4